MSMYNENNLFALYLTIKYGYSVDDALKAMGIKPTRLPPKRIALGNDELMRMLVKRNEGATYIDLSKEYDMSEIQIYKTLQKFSVENNLPLRTKRYERRKCSNV